MLSFHLDSRQLPGLSKALDTVSVRFAKHPDFRGLLCLEHDSVLHQIIVITMWDADGFDNTQAEFDLAQQEIAATIDLGVSSMGYDVVRLVTTAALEGSSVDAALAS